MEPPERTGPEPDLTVIVTRSGLRRQVERVLRRARLLRPPPITAPANGHGAPGAGPTGTIVFACDIDRPAAITELRRLSERTPEAAIVVLSPRATATGVRRTLDAGADAIVVEPELETTLVTTIRAVQSGQSVVPRDLRAGIERPYLSHRERQVLELVREGKTNAEVAESLFLAESTIKSHLAAIFTKFGVHSRNEAVATFADLYPAV